MCQKRKTEVFFCFYFEREDGESFGSKLFRSDELLAEKERELPVLLGVRVFVTHDETPRAEARLQKKEKEREREGGTGEPDVGHASDRRRQRRRSLRGRRHARERRTGWNVFVS